MQTSESGQEAWSEEGCAETIRRIVPRVTAMLRLRGIALTILRDASGPGFKVSGPLPDQGISLIYVRAKPSLVPHDERMTEPVLHARVFQKAPVSLRSVSAALQLQNLTVFTRSDRMRARISATKSETHPIAREYFVDLGSVLVGPHEVAARRMADFLGGILGHLRQG